LDDLMRIEFDYDFDSSGGILARHFIDTAPGKYPLVTHVALGALPVDLIQLIKAWHTGTIPIAGTGWDVITKHPSYPGQTRFAALKAEIIRLNDTAARGVLGI
jgi:hypothetical protein